MDSYREIESLILKYALLIDEGDFVGLGNLFSRGKIVTGETGEFQGSEEVSGMYMSTTRRYDDGTPRTHHVTTNISIKVHGESAESTSYFTVFQGLEDFPLQAIITGKYIDDFTLHEDGWWFSSREMEISQIGDLSRHLLIDLQEI
ncbi:MAG: hypothetical protein CL470_08820 [Acidimicrobiaceae bacterium]|nr:hypothetical protein [Acidimicrobiaceae bacterium]|tara:strand:- start:3038 stop:3475 length:438 start_codon:yes stop_codon:yes gene_type:complete